MHFPLIKKTFNLLTFNGCLFCLFQIIICTFIPFLIFPLIYFVPDEHHEREAAARRSQKSLTSKSIRNVGRGSQEGIGAGRERADGGIGGGGVELQKIETANGNAVTDEESHVGSDTEDVVDYIPGERARSEEIQHKLSKLLSQRFPVCQIQILFKTPWKRGLILFWVKVSLTLEQPPSPPPGGR